MSGESQKSSTNLPAILVIILAVLGFTTFPSGGGKPSENPAGSSAEAIEALGTNDPDDGWKTLGPLATLKADRSGLKAAFDSFGETPEHSHDGGFSERARILCSEPDLQFLIVLVPDPNESSMSHEFDVTLSAVQRATESAGFVAVRWSGIPRSAPEKKGRPADPSKSGGSADAEDKNPKESQDAWPGAVLCLATSAANDDVRSKKILILLVPESPTWGVDKARLAASVGLVQQYQRIQKSHRLKSPLSPSVRIVGPNFSGSLNSMVEVLKPYNVKVVSESKQPNLIIYNGRASSVSLAPFYTMEPGSIEFRSTIYSNKNLETMVKRFINRVSPIFSHPRIATLVESNTGYGQQSNQAPSEHPSTPEETAEFVTESFSFPLNISRIREEYAAKGLLQSNEPMKLQSPERLSPLEMAGRQGTRDLIPTVTPGPTAAVGEMALSQILLSLERGRFDWVGIVATNPNDRFFLAKKVRESCPDVRLFFTMPTTLFTHHTSVPYLRGSVIASTYPLDPDTQTLTASPGWDDGNKVDRLSFGNPYEEGIYNAAVAHLADLNYDKNPNFLDYAMPGETPPAGQSAPPIWITVVGQRGFYPVQALRPDTGWSDSAGAGFPKLGGLYIPRHKMILSKDFAPGLLSSSWVNLFISGSFMAIACSLFYLRIMLASKPPEGNRAWLTPSLQAFVDKHLPTGLQNWIATWLTPGLQERIDHPSAQRLVATSGSVALSLYLVSSAPAFAVFSLAKMGANDSRTYFLFTLACSTLVVLVLAASMALSRLVKQDERPWYGRVVMIINMSTILLCLSLLIIVVLSENSERLLDFSRTTRLVNGVTPLVPLLLLTLAGGVVMFGDLRRIGLRLRLKAALSSPPPQVGPLVGVAEQLRSASHCLDGPQGSWPRAGIWKAIPVWTAFSITGMFLTGSLPGAIEPQVIVLPWPIGPQPIYWLVFFVAFGMTLTLLVLRLVDMIGISMTLDRLLRRLADSPFLHAFDRLPAHLLHEDFWRPASLARSTKDESDPRVDRQLTAVLVGYLSNRTEILKELGKNTHDLEALHLRSEEFCRPERTVSDDLWPPDRTDPPDPDSDLTATVEAWPIDTPHAAALKPCGLSTKNWWRAVNLFSPLLVPYWAARPVVMSYPDVEKASSGNGSDDWTGVENEKVRHWMVSVEDLIAMILVRQFAWLRAAVESILSFLVAGLVLMSLVLTSYPFEPQSAMFSVLGVLTAITVGAVFVIAVQASRDEVLSRLLKTPADRFSIDRNFLRTMATSVVPLLGLLGALSYSLADLIRSLFEPFFRSG